MVALLTVKCIKCNNLYDTYENLVDKALCLECWAKEFTVKKEVKQMEEAKTSLWDSVNPDKEVRPKIVFEFNIPVEVEFPVGFQKPEEYPSQYGEDDEKKTYCVFPVIHNGEEASIVTSAYSLLRGLKANMPLDGKKLKITKKMDKSKQQYVVELV